MTDLTTRPTRRSFMKSAALAAVPTVVPAPVLGRGATPPSERIRLGAIGLSNQGTGLLRSFLGNKSVYVAAVCDLQPLHYRDRAWGEGQPLGRQPAADMVRGYYGAKSGKQSGDEPSQYEDYRELCARGDVDAVCIAVPDHWHALIALEALKSGKDVYCEKPVTHLFREGQVVRDEAAKRGAVFQVGSQQRSNYRFRRAAELVRNGLLGTVRKVEAGLPPGYSKPMDSTEVTEPPENLDYGMWCGPSGKLPYMRARHHRWWRGNRAFGGGNIMDWIGHHNDIAHWALGLDETGPVKVEAVGWTLPETDVYDTPVDYEILCQYEGGVTISISSRHAAGVKWIGEDGWVYVNRPILEASDSRWTERGFDPGPEKLPESNNHTGNFIDCVKTRRQCIAPPAVGHRSITPGHLGYLSFDTGKPLRWDPEAEEVVGDKEADAMLKRVDYRAPWSIGEPAA